jgi:transposase
MSDGPTTLEEVLEALKAALAENERLRRRIAELEAELEEAKKLAARQAAPFRRRENLKKPEAEKKKPGRKPGHPGAYRVRPQILDESLEVPLCGCPHCGGPVNDPQKCEQFIQELPPIQPVSTKLITYVGTCPKCGEVRSTHPLQTSTAVGAAGTHLGPRAQALAIGLSHLVGLTTRKTCRVLRDLCGLSITPGGLSQLLQRAAKHMQIPFEAILQNIRRSAAVFSDETSWYVGRPGWWLWVFTTPQNTLYRIEGSRGSDVVKDTLGPDFDGMLISDCLATYNPIDCRKHKCIAHHLRELKRLDEQLKKRGVDSQYLLLWKLHLLDVIDTWKLRAEMPMDEWAAKVLQLHKGVNNLLERQPQEPEEVRFRDRLKRQRNHLLGCLSEPSAEPTNNRAERDLRPAVIDRKLSCGNKTQDGKEAWEVLRSLVVTYANQGREITTALTQWLQLSQHLQVNTS